MLEEGTFRVWLARSGGSVVVGRDESILEAVRRAGVRVPSSCEAGTCGTCETTVLAGVPDHRDQIIAPSDRPTARTLMICCSRSLTPDLTLEI